MLRPRLQQRQSALVIGLLVAGLGACTHPGPGGGPAKTNATPSPRLVNKPEAAQTGGERQLQQTLSSAEDLFNRGENDLACEQVQRAEALRRKLQTPPAAGSAAQLDRFSRACSAL